MVAAGLLSFTSVQPLAAPLSRLVTNVTGMYSVEVADIKIPETSAQVSELIRTWPGQVAIGGGRYSMGGQIALYAGLHVDMRKMNKLVWLRPTEYCVRVQAGMRWRDLQDHLDSVGLAVKTMQSYSNFTVGGSVSVNCHGRYVGHGPIANTVRSLQLVLADGSVVEANRTERPDLFRSVIGGYGAIAVITEVELEVTNNVRIERTVEEVSLENYVQYFKENVLTDKRAVLHNADLLPPEFDRPVAVTWRQTSESTALTETDKLVPRDQSYGLERNVIWAVTELPGGQLLRKKVIQPILQNKPAVKWLNREASLDVRELEPLTRTMSTYVLQEYFIPEEQAIRFVREMAQVLQKRAVVALNISIRHSPKDPLSLVPWAKQDVFSFVLYYKQRTWQRAREEVGRWTRELVDLALAHNGRYYLPYQLHATTQQFNRAYPEVEQLRQLKAIVDPKAKFFNELWRKYL